MSRALDDATAGSRLALTSMATAALALLAPVLLLTTFEAPATVSLAVATLVLAALVQLGEHGTVPAVRVAAVGPPTRDEAPPVLAGRTTDPTHHPLRPRAPGLA